MDCDQIPEHFQNELSTNHNFRLNWTRYSTTFHRNGMCNGNALDLHWGTARFESRQGHRLLWLSHVQPWKCRASLSIRLRPLTSFLSPWSWALLEKPPVTQPLKNFPAFYGTQSFIAVSISWASSIQSTPPHPISLRSILLSLIYVLVFLVVSFLLTFPSISFPLRPHSCYISCPASFLIPANSSIIPDTDGAVKQTAERIYVSFPVDLHSEGKSVGACYSSGGYTLLQYDFNHNAVHFGSVMHKVELG
jgi:hypothetical protein